MVGFVRSRQKLFVCAKHANKKASFDITGFTSFFSNAFTSNGMTVPIFFASDILYCPTTDCTGGTGDVGASTPTPVPGPLVGAGLPGLIAACVGLVGLNRRRRNKIA
jgi:hypothetical protein